MHRLRRVRGLLQKRLGIRPFAQALRGQEQLAAARQKTAKRCLNCSLKYAACMAVLIGGGQVIMYAVAPHPGLLVAKWFIAVCAQMLVLGFIVHKVYQPPAK